MKDHPLMIQPTIADIAWLEPTMIFMIGFSFGLLLGVIALNKLKEDQLEEKNNLLMAIKKHYNL